MVNSQCNFVRCVDPTYLVGDFYVYFSLNTDTSRLWIKVWVNITMSFTTNSNCNIFSRFMVLSWNFSVKRLEPMIELHADKPSSSASLVSNSSITWNSRRPCLIVIKSICLWGLLFVQRVQPMSFTPQNLPVWFILALWEQIWPEGPTQVNRFCIFLQYQFGSVVTPWWQML